MEFSIFDFKVQLFGTLLTETLIPAQLLYSKLKLKLLMHLNFYILNPYYFFYKIYSVSVTILNKLFLCMLFRDQYLLIFIPA